MSTYKVIGKHLYRASIQPTQMGVAPDGTPVIVSQPGPMARVEVGALLTDVRDDEVAAFGDRLELLSDEDVAAMQAAAEAAEVARQEADAAAKVQAADVAAADAAQKAVEAAEVAKQAQHLADATKEQASKAHASPSRRASSGPAAENPAPAASPPESAARTTAAEAPAPGREPGTSGRR